MTIGDIHWVDFPPSGGHEQSGRRPAIVLQDDDYGGALATVLVLPLTSALQTLRFTATVRVEPSPQNGLSQPSVALVFQLRVLDRRFIGVKTGFVDASTLAAIFAELDKLTGR